MCSPFIKWIEFRFGCVRATASPKGFTLVEVILALLVLGVSGAVVGLGIVQVTQNYAFALKNQTVHGKAQLAMYRLIKEFSMIESVSSGSTSSISYTRQTSGGGTTNVTVALAGSEVLLNGNVLVDNVQSFSLGYYNKYDKGVQTSFNSDRTMIEITLNMLAAGDIAQEFKTRVAFRYL